MLHAFATVPRILIYSFCNSSRNGNLQICAWRRGLSPILREYTQKSRSLSTARRQTCRLYQLSANQHRHFTTGTSTLDKKNDWSAAQYLKFGNERTRPVYDLLSQVIPHVTSKTPRIYDLGCGPGNSTKALLEAFPNAHITGIDSSPDMLDKARINLPDVEFVQGSLQTFSPGEFQKEQTGTVDLLFSNAAFHWLRHQSRMVTLRRLLDSLSPGGVLAFQVPTNYQEPSHRLMRRVALEKEKLWSPFFRNARVGIINLDGRPDLDPVCKPYMFYNHLSEYCSHFDIWTIRYEHVLENHAAIVEWVKGTGLHPFLQCIEDEQAKEAFLKAYEEKLLEAYIPMRGGKVLLQYPRLFVVAVRK